MLVIMSLNLMDYPQLRNIIKKKKNRLRLVDLFVYMILCEA